MRKIMGFIAAAAWLATWTFLILVYGMQFDILDEENGTSGTTQRWLYGFGNANAQSILINEPWGIIQQVLTILLTLLSSIFMSLTVCSNSIGYHLGNIIRLL
jgi:hypothetical protein